MDEWIEEVCTYMYTHTQTYIYTHTVAHYSVIRKASMSFTKKWVDFKVTELSEISEDQKSKSKK